MAHEADFFDLSLPTIAIKEREELETGRLGQPMGAILLALAHAVSSVTKERLPGSVVGGVDQSTEMISSGMTLTSGAEEGALYVWLAALPPCCRSSAVVFACMKGLFSPEGTAWCRTLHCVAKWREEVSPHVHRHTVYTANLHYFCL
jgi:hypothetical protein